MYSHQPKTYHCPFCLVVQGIENEHVLTTQDHIILTTDKITAFVSSHQFTKRGTNVLIIPNEHYENIYTLPSHYGSDIQGAKRLIALAFKEIYACDGVSTRQHNEPAGYQDVWHYHEHLTARFENDKLYSGMEKVLVPTEIRSEHALKLREALTKLQAT